MCAVGVAKTAFKGRGGCFVAACSRFLRWFLLLHFFICINVFTCYILLQEKKTRRKDKKSGAFGTAFGMLLPAFEIAIYVGIDKGGNGKGWSGQQEV